MVKRLKGLVLAFVILLSATGMTACGGRKEAMPDYSDDIGVKTVRFAGLTEPPPAGYYHYEDKESGTTTTNLNFSTVERYTEAVEAGIDILIAHAQPGIVDGNDPDDPILAALDAAEEAGAKLIVNYQSAVNFGNSTPENIDTVLGATLSHPACYGIVVKDEPGYTSFASLGRAYDVFSQLQEQKPEYADKYFYINLLPAYGVSEISYPEYIETYCQLVGTNYISTDFYPYNSDGLNHSVRENWLYNLEVMQKAAVRYDMEHWEYLQGCQAYPQSKRPDYNDLRQEIYASMAYGTELFQYYCYWTPAEFGEENDHYSCLIDCYGKQTDIYEAAKKINNEIHAFEHVYMNFVDGWLGVMTFVGSNNELGYNSAFNLLQSPVTKHGRIKSVETQEDLVVGCFRNEDNYDGFMVVNYSVPGENKPSNVKMTFNGATKAVCYIGGQEVVKDLNKGVLELSLGAGEGVFVIPVNA